MIQLKSTKAAVPWKGKPLPYSPIRSFVVITVVNILAVN